tara:strand:+ start:3955 stop:4362 length:408 start_codon:yes stop_codon:yes gene_type:complete
MYQELTAELPQSGFFFSGVNEAGYDNFDNVTNAASTQPWIQDTDEDDVWHSWEVAYRDVVIIDGENKRRAVFNLTTDTLYLPDNYEHMKNTIRHLILYDTLPPEPEPEATDAGPGATDAGEGVTNANSDGWQGPF